MSKMCIDLAKTPLGRLPLIRQTLSGATMGTRYSAVFYTAPGTNVAALNTALFAAVDRVDRQMSNWKAESDLNRLNDAPEGVWVDIPRELMTVLEASLQIECATNGAFDIGVGKQVEAWGFGPARQTAGSDQPPVTASEPGQAASAVLELSRREGRARKSAPITLDLSGIAKGFGVDEMARVMVAFRIPSWLVGIDGEMRAKGAKPDGSMWAVAHERPDRQVREAMGVLELQDMAVATSGNYRHFREVGGRIISHTIDPRTGVSLLNEVASVTVLAPRCMTADAWATALIVMGVEAGLEAAQAHGFDVIFVLQDGSVRSTL
jgi:thiamine biosynthesis lipoprotein